MKLIRYNPQESRMEIYSYTVYTPTHKNKLYYYTILGSIIQDMRYSSSEGWDPYLGCLKYPLDGHPKKKQANIEKCGYHWGIMGDNMILAHS